MALQKLKVMTPQEGYSANEGESVLRAKLSGGPGRQRLDMFGASPIVDVNLVLSPSEYSYWKAFFRTAIKMGSLPFLIDLIVDSSGIEECLVQIIPGSVQLASIQGDAHIVPLQLEIFAKPTDEIADQALIDLFGVYGDESGELLNILEWLVNIKLPAELG